MATNRLSERQITQYRTEGYLVVPSLFDESEMDDMHRVIDQMTRDAIASGKPETLMELEPESINGQRVPRRIYNPY